jgi:competence protein ComFC
LSLLTALTDIIFPPLPCCQICGSVYNPIGPVPLCNTCLSSMNLVRSPYCSVCGMPLLKSEAPKPLKFWHTDEAKCQGCLIMKRSTNSFSVHRSVGIYEGFLRDLLLSYKFNNRAALALPLGRLMSQLIIELRPFPRFDIIVPVPINSQRLYERGYNQSKLLADEISNSLKLDLVEALYKTSNAIPQSRLNSADREENIKGRFKCEFPGAVQKKKVLVVDDIYTTGATLRECSQILLEAGASDVFAITLAMTPFHGQAAN